MSDGITVEFNAEPVIAKFTGSSEALLANLRQAVLRIGISVQAEVKENKLSGQVLHVRTGTLRRSINQQVSEDSTGIYGQVGTNVEYAAVHEYGGQRMPMRSYLRSTLREKEGEIVQTLREAALRSVTA